MSRWTDGISLFVSDMRWVRDLDWPRELAPPDVEEWTATSHISCHLEGSRFDDLRSVHQRLSKKISVKSLIPSSEPRTHPPGGQATLLAKSFPTEFQSVPSFLLNVRYFAKASRLVARKRFSVREGWAAGASTHEDESSDCGRES